jgi:hypothetical protein
MKLYRCLKINNGKILISGFVVDTVDDLQLLSVYELDITDLI